MNLPPIQYFQQFHASGTTIRLLNAYKGLPIANDASITAVEPGAIVVSSIKAQVVCMFLEHKTFIQNPALPQIVEANILQMDSARMEVRLGGFRYTNSRIGERRQVRVSPVEGVTSQIQRKNMRGAVRAELADISQTGLAIYLPTHFYVPEVFAVGLEMIVHLNLPFSLPAHAPLAYNAPTPNDPMARFNRETLRGVPHTGPLYTGENDDRKNKPPSAGSELVLRAEIMNINREQNRVRIGMRQFPNLETQSILASFINHRQSELVREVKTLYELLNKFER